MNTRAKYKTVAIIFLAVLLTVSIVFIGYKGFIKLNYPIKYEKYVEKYSSEYNVPQNLLYAVIKTESSFDPNAQSHVGAVGLTQIMPDTFDWIKHKMGTNDSFESLRDEEISIKCGAFLLGYLLDEFENPEAALSAYHAGRGNVNKWLSDKKYSRDGKHLDEIPIPETAHYVRKVMRSVDIYNNLNPISDERTDK